MTKKASKPQKIESFFFVSIKKTPSNALYQMDEEDKKIPIQFIFKKLNPTEFGWYIVKKKFMP